MHGRKLVASATVGLIVLFSAGLAPAEKLRGTNLLGATLDVYHWGESVPTVNETPIDEFNRSYGASIFWNYSLNTHWDLTLGYSGVWDSEDDIALAGSTNTLEITGQMGTVGLTYLFLPDAAINPYAGGSVGIAHDKVEFASETGTETDAAFGAVLGVEWDACQDAFVDASIFYNYEDNGAPKNDGIYGVNVTTGIILIEDLILTAGGSYTFEDEDAVIQIGAIIQL